MLMNLVARFITEFNVPAALAFVGLAAPGDAGSWQRESKVQLCTLVILSYIRRSKRSYTLIILAFILVSLKSNKKLCIFSAISISSGLPILV